MIWSVGFYCFIRIRDTPFEYFRQEAKDSNLVPKRIQVQKTAFTAIDLGSKFSKRIVYQIILTPEIKVTVFY